MIIYGDIAKCHDNYCDISQQCLVAGTVAHVWNLSFGKQVLCLLADSFRKYVDAYFLRVITRF